MPRIRMNLDGFWEFFTDPFQRLSPDTFEQADPPRRIRVPGPWQAQFDDLRQYTGAAWYRLRFELPPNLSADGENGATYILHFGAVDYFTAVWLNGRYIDTHEGGYLPFEFVLDKAINLNATNELLLRVLDPGTEGDLQGETEAVFNEIPHGKQSWYGPIGGIWQSVYLEKRSATFIRELHITPNLAQEFAHIRIELNRPLPDAARLTLTLLDPLANQQQLDYELHAAARTFEIQLPITDPIAWDTRTPHLYQLTARLTAGDAGAVDELSSHFGMRSISTTPDGHLMLNGRALYLRGALDQDYYPELIYTPFSDEELNRQFAQAKHMGLNCLRTHIKITDPRYYDAADRAGILIWTELPNWANLTSVVRDRVRQTLAGMIARDWNHPSIIIWTLVNESWGVDLANPMHRQWLAEIFDYVKGLDPNRLVVGNSACFSNFHVVTDIQDFHNYYAIPDHYRKWRSWVENFATRPSWVYAHEYGGFTEWREFLRDPWNPTPRAFAPEVRRTGGEPMVISEFGNWGLPDVQALRACYDGADPWWFETGMEWGDGAVYPHGVERRFALWQLDQVFGTLSNLAVASQWMQFKALKYEIEQIRLHANIVGYVITEFTDVHWECNGLLDMCRNPKVFYDTLTEINAADTLIASWLRISYWAAEECTLELVCSHFSDKDLQGSRVEWSLDAFPEIHGVFDGLEIMTTGNTRVGHITFHVPDLHESARVVLAYRLLDANGELVTQNHQDFYFFPRSLRRAPPIKLAADSDWQTPLRVLGYEVTDNWSEAELVVMGTMTDRVRDFLQHGGRVLWLAEDSTARQTFLGGLEIAPRQGRRWQGDWASNFNWIQHKDMFSALPTNHMLDFCFADLIPENVILGIPPRDFGADVYAGIFVGWVHHVAALVARRRLGEGLLMVSTFCLLQQITSGAQHPVATIMLHDMIRQLAAERTHSPAAPGNLITPA